MKEWSQMENDNSSFWTQKKHERDSPLPSMYLKIKNTLKAFGANPAHFSDLLLNPGSPFPDQSHCCKKAEAKDNSLLPPRGTCLNLRSKFSDHHASTIWFHRGKQKKVRWSCEGLLNNSFLSRILHGLFRRFYMFKH